MIIVELAHVYIFNIILEIRPGFAPGVLRNIFRIPKYLVNKIPWLTPVNYDKVNEGTMGHNVHIFSAFALLESIILVPFITPDLANTPAGDNYCFFLIFGSVVANAAPESLVELYLKPMRCQSTNALDSAFLYSWPGTRSRFTALLKLVARCGGNSLACCAHPTKSCEAPDMNT